MNRVGGPTNRLLDQNGIDTMVKEAKPGELSKWNQRNNLSAKDKMLTKGYRVINEISSQLNIKEAAKEKAKIIFK